MERLRVTEELAAILAEQGMMEREDALASLMRPLWARQASQRCASANESEAFLPPTPRGLLELAKRKRYDDVS
jgi:hypothetical protein